MVDQWRKLLKLNKLMILRPNSKESIKSNVTHEFNHNENDLITNGTRCKSEHLDFEGVFAA